jgi:hypothetical protein
MKFGFTRVHAWVAECIVVDSSSFSRSAFYLHAFVLFRFVPAKHLHFDYGFRIGSRWESVSDRLVDAVRASRTPLAELASLDGLLGAATRPNVNLYHAELRLCIAVLKGDHGLFATTRECVSSWAVTLPWEPDVLARCEEVTRSVQEGGFPRGVEVLEQRRADIDRLLT